MLRLVLTGSLGEVILIILPHFPPLFLHLHKLALPLQILRHGNHLLVYAPSTVRRPEVPALIPMFC